MCVCIENWKKNNDDDDMCIEPNGKKLFLIRGDASSRHFFFFLAWQLMKAYSVMTSVETKGVIDYNRRLISTRTEKKSSFLFCPARGGDPVI